MKSIQSKLTLKCGHCTNKTVRHQLPITNKTALNATEKKGNEARIRSQSQLALYNSCGKSTLIALDQNWEEKLLSVNVWGRWQQPVKRSTWWWYYPTGRAQLWTRFTFNFGGDAIRAKTSQMNWSTKDWPIASIWTSSPITWTTWSAVPVVSEPLPLWLDSLTYGKWSTALTLSQSYEYIGYLDSFVIVICQPIWF